jgi:hypothetical protein
LKSTDGWRRTPMGSPAFLNIYSNNIAIKISEK